MMVSRACSLALLCLTATLTSGQKLIGEGKECVNAPPNIGRIFLGVDISTLDLLPIDFTNVNGYKMPIVDFTCNDERVYVDKGVQYEMPDQVFRISKIPGGWLSADVQTYKTSSDIRSNFNAQVEGGGNYYGFSFSASASYSKLQNTVSNQERYVSDTSTFHSSNKVELFPGFVLPLNPIAQRFIDEEIGGKTYEKNPEIYHKFIDLFGTHYFSSAQFGGQVRVVYSTSNEFLKAHSEEEITVNAKASYMESFSVEASASNENTEVDEDFAKATSNSVRYYGGETNLLAADALSVWQPTVDANPWVFSGSLKPVSELIRNPTHKKGIETAAQQHVMRNHFQELWRQIKTAREKLRRVNLVESLAKELTEMEKLDLGKLNARDVRRLSDTIDDAVNVPRWFSEDTKMCLRFRANGNDHDQCGKGSPPDLCATPGEYTPSYVDDSDNRDGGCVMQWTIQSVGYEKWFKNVKICFRWLAEDDAAQCNDAASDEYCAAVNAYTRSYVDDTNNRRGGCKLSWRLSVPERAPMWLKSTKLCFEWEPTDRADQCDSYPQRRRCAAVNAWTEYYNDKTDGKNGGCKMRWSLQLGL